MGMGSSHLCIVLVMGEYTLTGLSDYGMLTYMSALDMASIETTSVAGRAMRCKRLWMRYRVASVLMRAAMFFRSSLLNRLRLARRSNRLLRILVLVEIGSRSCLGACPSLTQLRSDLDLPEKVLDVE